MRYSCFLTAANHALLSVFFTIVPVSAEPTAEQLEFFEARIRPVLVEHCYRCHNSIDSAEGGLAVDSREGVLAGGDGGEIVFAGKPEESRLLAVLRHEVDGMEMPQEGPKLSERTIADFQQWIADGLADPRDKPPTAQQLRTATSWQSQLASRKQWWSFQPILRPAVPDVPGVHGSTNPIDRFIATKLEEAKLRPAGLAEPAVLVRRLYFTLIGLPPSVEEAKLWTSRIRDSEEADRDKVVEELIDLLIANPHFGERWARHWMDWLRYAETHGSEGDPEIEGAWLYRDYLIRAINADVPYDQLVREHIAGDLLESPRINNDLRINESLIGTAQWRMVFHGFSPTDALDEKVRFIDDQINVFSKAFLGLTISCARCHDHKFDAISQRDYYALFGILGSCRPGRSAIDLPEDLATNRKELISLKQQIRNALAEDWLQSLSEFGKRLTDDEGPWTKADKPEHVLHAIFLVRQEMAAGSSFREAWEKYTGIATREKPNVEATSKWNLSESKDYAAWFPTGQGLLEAPALAGEFSLATDGDAVLTGIYPSGVYSHPVSTKLPSRLTSGDFQVGEGQEVWLLVRGDGGATVRYVVHDYPRSGTIFPVQNLKDQWSWQRFDLDYWSGDTIHLELASTKDAPLLVKDNPRSWFGIRQAMVLPIGSPQPSDLNENGATLIKTAEEKPPQSERELIELIVQTLISAVKAWREATLTDAQALLLDASLSQGVLSNQLNAVSSAKPLVEKYRRLENEIPVPTRAPSLEETIAVNQRLFERGNHKLPQEAVPRRFLEAFDASPYTSDLSGRRELAEDVLRADNPLTRRVVVNRLWHHLFGQGLVRTTNNFGRLGDTPIHPELLDWLAIKFVDNFWSFKQTIRMIVMSRTWQLASSPLPEAIEKDPDNRLFSHAGVRRLEAEAIRDSLLNAAGILEDRLYGPPVAEESPRRSVYLKVVRNSLTPLLRVFDFPEAFSSTGRRDVTNVPAQSLTLMNDPAVSRYAATWASRLLDNAELSSDENRIDHMFLTAFSRHASPDELVEVESFLSTARNQYQALFDKLTELQTLLAAKKSRRDDLLNAARAQLLALPTGESNKQQSLPPQPLASWDFDEKLNKPSETLQLSAKNGAHIKDGALVLDGKGYVVTASLAKPISEKTLEAWVEIASLDQRGGGVMSLQTPDGMLFDSIVFGEQQPSQWLAGSNNFSRTKSFSAPAETEATARAVHIAISYYADGRIAAYRDGKPYGKPYQSNGPLNFAVGEAIVSFGVRHLPAVGNRLLSGKIYQARLYDRALTDEEIEASFLTSHISLSQSRLMESITSEEREEVRRLESEMHSLQSDIDALGFSRDTSVEQAVWADLARAFFTFQEFIYVR